MNRFKDNKIESLNSYDNFNLPKLDLKRSSINTENQNSKHIYSTLQSSPSTTKLDDQSLNYYSRSRPT